MKHSRFGIFCLVIGLVVFGFFVNTTRADTITPSAATPSSATGTINTNIPGTNATTQQNPNPGGIIINFYQFALMVGGLLAFVIIVFAGIKHAVSADNPSGQSDAKDMIKQALLGLLLLVGAYLILKTINPQLTNLKLPELERLKKGEGLCDSAVPSNLNADGSQVACGTIHNISASETCLGTYCARHFGGDWSYCSLTGSKSGPSNWTAGSCVTGPVQGISVKDPSKVYDVSPNSFAVTLGQDCGHLTRDTPSRWTVGVECSDKLSCVSYNAPPVRVSAGVLDGTARNFECR